MVDLIVHRFLKGRGIGGGFGLAVALVAATAPDGAQEPALGLPRRQAMLLNGAPPDM